MRFSHPQPSFLLLVFLSSVVLCSSSFLGTPSLEPSGAAEGIGRRVLLSFRETPEGSNLTFECYPSGLCVACQYSEKNEEKYQCSETGYRMPLKCIEVRDGSEAYTNESQKDQSEARNLLEDSSNANNALQPYITYRSCIPFDDQEKLSVAGFEGIILFLLIVSGSFIYFRRKWMVTISGAGLVRVPSNSRF